MIASWEKVTCNSGVHRGGGMKSKNYWDYILMIVFIMLIINMKHIYKLNTAQISNRQRQDRGINT